MGYNFKKYQFNRKVTKNQKKLQKQEEAAKFVSRERCRQPQHGVQGREVANYKIFGAQYLIGI